MGVLTSLDSQRSGRGQAVASRSGTDDTAGCQPEVTGTRPAPTVPNTNAPAHPEGMDAPEHPTRLEPLLTSEELANYLQVPIKTLYEWRSNGTGPSAYRFGKHTRYRACDVQEWLADRVA